MGYMLSRSKQNRKFFSEYKKRRYATIISHVMSNESNNFNTLNSDNVIVTSNITKKNVQNYSPLNTIITLQKLMYTPEIISINDERTDQKILLKKFLLIKILEQLLDHKCDKNGINLVDT